MSLFSSRWVSALSSGEGPGGAALAISFALLLGLTPLLSPHNIVIILLVLILRVNILLFVPAAIFFSFLSYAFVPIIEALGVAILIWSPLQGFWSAMYTSTFWRFLGFNDSAVAGGLLLGAILFLPAYVAVVRGSERRSSCRGAFSGSDNHRTTIFRPEGFLFFAIFIFLILVAVLLFKGIYFKRAFVRAASNVTGAEVSVSSASLTFSPPAFKVGGVSIEYPGGRAEAESIEFSLDAHELFRGSFITEEMVISGLSLRPGASGTYKTETRYAGEGFAMPEFTPLLAADILKDEELRSPGLASALIDDIEGESEELKRLLRGLPDAAKFDSYRKRLEELRSRRSKGGAYGMLSSREEAERLEASIRKEVKYLEQLKKEYYYKDSSFKKRLKKAKDAPLEEIVRLTEKHGPVSAGLERAGESIFGPLVVRWTDAALWWYEKASVLLERDFKVKGRATIRKPVGGGSRFVVYDTEATWPHMLVRKGLFSGSIGPWKISGKVFNITPDQDLLRLPTVLSLKSENEGSAEGSAMKSSLSFDATLARIEKSSTEDMFLLDIDGYGVETLELGGGEELRASLSGGTLSASLTATIDRGSITATFKALFSGAAIEAKAQDSAGPVALAVSRVLSGEAGVDLIAVASGTVGRGYDLKVRSSMDDRLASVAVGAAGELGGEFERRLIVAVTEASKEGIEEAEAALGNFGRIAPEFTERLEASEGLVKGGAVREGESWIKWPFKKKDGGGR